MKLRALILFGCMSLLATQAFAHGDMIHVIGTVAKVAPDSITVKTTAGPMVTVAVAPTTKFVKDKAAAKVADLNVGNRVVIHAVKDDDGKLTADTVEFATPKPAAVSK